jgi:hypothetical protein
MGEFMAKSKPRRDVAIGKLDILATYTRAEGELGGMSEDDAKVRGMVAAIMGAQMRTGIAHQPRGQEDPFRAEEERAERKKKSSIAAETFDHQVADKMGDFFDDVFLPLTKLVQAGLTYEQVKDVVGIPSRWRTKIGGEQFKERASSALEGG